MIFFKFIKKKHSLPHPPTHTNTIGSGSRSVEIGVTLFL